MTTKLLSRVRLRDDVPAAALRAVLMPEDKAARAATSHQLIWTLFADSPERERDFLWREHQPGLFYLLSERVPSDLHGLFDVAPPKDFALALKVGDRLTFDLRVNATVARGGGPGVRGKPCDIVMDAIHKLPVANRAESRTNAMNTVARAWMERAGARSGFDLSELEVLGYSAIEMHRGRHRASAKFGVLDLHGILSVSDPTLFVSSLSAGFGRAKAFGCGLMMVRRA